MTKSLEIVSVSYRQHENGELPRFVDNFLKQSSQDYFLQVWHDGPGNLDGTRAFMEELVKEYPENFVYYESGVREHFPQGPDGRDGIGYGGFNRARGLAKATCPLLSITNCDNEYEIDFVKTVLDNFDEGVDFLSYQIRHSYFGYAPFWQGMWLGGADMMQIVVRTELAKQTGFNHRTSGQDGHFFDELRLGHPNAVLKHLPIVLGTHN